MRSLTTNTYNKTQTDTGTEPIIIIEVHWSTGNQYYSDKTFTVGSYNCSGRILSLSAISSTGKQDTSGEVSSVGVTLDDTDGSLKDIVDTLIIEGTIATIYHYYAGNDAADAVVMLHGKITGDIDWSEGERTLSFNIESYVEDAEVGYAPEDGDFTDLNPDVIGQAVPIVVGSVAKVPALPIIKSYYGRTTEAIYGGIPSLETSPFQVTNGDKFPQGTTITIAVGGTLFRGYFDNDIFHRSESNLLWYTNVVLADRPTDDPDYENYNIAWVSAGVDLVSKYCYHPDLGFRECIIQEGTKCTFSAPWNSLLDSTNQFTEVRGCIHSTWYDGTDTYLNYWFIHPQRKVRQYNTGTSDIYACNLFPSTSILEVYGYRRYKNEDIFVPIPSSYYTKHLSYSLNGYNMTAIEFTKPLEDYEGEGWNGDIYVSMRSTINSNSSDIIKAIFETYTSFSIDTTSFNSVRALVNPYPCGFALFRIYNVIELAEEIAWQSRCALYIRNGIVSIKYLSYNPVSLYSIQNQDVLFKTLNLSFTSTDDLITKLEAVWHSDYSGRNSSKHKLVYKNNISTFGLKEQSREIFIYNIEELVKMTLYFWGYRYSNSWRIFKAVTFLRTLGLEIYDVISSQLRAISAYNIKGIVEELAHDTNEFEIACKVLLASKAGDTSSGEPVEDSNFWIGDPSYPVQPRLLDDPLDGATEVDYTVPIDESNSRTSSRGTVNEDSYYLFFEYPTTDYEIERDTNFTIRVLLYYENGTRAYNDIDIVLSLHSDDSNDELSIDGGWENNVSLVNGVYEITTVQVTGGSGTDLGFLSAVSSDDNIEADTVNIKIIDEKTGTLTWDTEPSTVSRGVPFTVEISGGTGGSAESIDVTTSFLDPNDKLYDSDGTLLTSIEIDAAGEYSGSWYISGGAGSEATNTITLVDSVNEKYADSTCSNFTIAGTSIQSITDTVILSQVVSANAAVLELTLLDGIIGNNETFHLSATLKDSDGNTIDHDGTIEISMKDANDASIYWLYPDAAWIVEETMTDGVAFGAGTDCEVQLTVDNVSPATITASVEYGGSTVTGTLTVNLATEQSISQTLTVLQTIFGRLWNYSLNQNLSIEDELTSEQLFSFEESLIQSLVLSQVITIDHDAYLDNDLSQNLTLEQVLTTVQVGDILKSLSQTLALDDVLTALNAGTQKINQELTIYQVLQHGTSSNKLAHELTIEDVLTSTFSVNKSLSHTLLIEDDELSIGNGLLASFEVIPSTTTTIMGSTHTFDLEVRAKDGDGNYTQLTDTVNLTMALSNGSNTTLTALSVSTIELVDGIGTLTDVYIDVNTGSSSSTYNHYIKASYSAISSLSPQITIGWKLIDDRFDNKYKNYSFYGIDTYYDDTTPLTVPSCTTWAGLQSSALVDCQDDTVSSVWRNDDLLYCEYWPDAACAFYNYEGITAEHRRNAFNIPFDSEGLTLFKLRFSIYYMYYNSDTGTSYSTNNTDFYIYLSNDEPSSGNFSSTNAVHVNSSSWTYVSGTTNYYIDIEIPSNKFPDLSQDIYLYVYSTTVFPCPIPNDHVSIYTMHVDPERIRLER